MGAIEGARPSAGSARAQPSSDCPQSLVATLGRRALGPPRPVGPLCRLRCRGAGWCGPRRCGPRLLPPGPKRLLQAFSQTEVLGIPAPGKDSPQLGCRPSTAPTQAASPWKLQRRPGEVGAETQLGGWAGGGGGLSLFQAFPGLSSLVASSSHRLLGSRSRRFCRPPHHYRPRPRTAGQAGLGAQRAAGTKAHLRPAAGDASIPPAAPPPISLTHPPGLGPLGLTSRRAGATAEGRGRGEPCPKEGPPLGPGSGVFSINRERPWLERRSVPSWAQ